LQAKWQVRHEHSVLTMTHLSMVDEHEQEADDLDRSASVQPVGVQLVCTWAIVEENSPKYI
jgi:hypothetical protein